MTPAFGLVLAGGTLYFLSVGIVSPVLPVFVSKDRHGANLVVGLVVGAFALAAVVARPLAGRLCGSLGTRTMMVLGALIASASTAAYGQCPDNRWLFGARLVTGLGEGFFFTGVTTLVADLAPSARRGAALSLLSVTVFLGTGVGPLVSVPLANVLGASWTFAIAGAAGTVAAGVCRLCPDTGRHAQRTALVNRKAFGPGLAMAMNSIGSAGFFVYVPLYAARVHASVQLTFALYAVIILSVRIFGAALPDRLGAAQCGMSATVLDALGLFVVTATGTCAGLYVGAALLALGGALLYPALITLTLGRSQVDERASASEHSPPPSTSAKGSAG
jgi:MFS family permease